MITVKVIKFSGETGLRKPGSLYSCDEKTAAFLEGKGLVSIPEKVGSSAGPVKVETKELKTVKKKPRKRTKIETK